MELRLLAYFVAVAEERHFGRAAVRLHMTQPPLSRAIRRLETDLGATLLHRSPAGVTLTAAGQALLEEARTLLEQAARARARVTAAATLTIGTLAGNAEQARIRLADGFRARHPDVTVRIREADLGDPAAGLRTGLADVALTRLPFDRSGLRVHVLREDPVGAVLRADDPLARRDVLHLRDLAGRRWFQFPDGTDPLWRDYWNAGEPREGPVVRTVEECVQAVLWNGTVGLTPLPHHLPGGLTAVRLADQPPSPVVVAWADSAGNPLIRSFLDLVAAVSGS
ncbi:LysR family transcriptional regulator [Nonomuraea typhae]|uniref:LysR family transcriptional regulator n=1 Tax=Nonomuraea typhae TaxID=2603600 RepID=A0ABW7YUX9_9ACTN